MKRIGFIGSGNMGSAMIKGICNDSNFSNEDVFVFEKDIVKVKALVEQYKVNYSCSINALLQSVDVVVLAVKPNIYSVIIEQINNCNIDNKLFISIAAGMNYSLLNDMFKDNAKFVVTMPNTPALVSSAMCLICENDLLTEKDYTFLRMYFSAFGKYKILTEDAFDAFIGIAGSAPAYFYMFIDSIAKTGSKYGIEYSDALEIVCNTAIGASKMILETNTDPSVLTNNVCSPGGTTIEAVNVFKEYGLDTLVDKAVSACINKSKKMRGE